MGEYATYNGGSVKIGTCEDMYYLRADQACKVVPQSGSVDPVGQAELIRFRFPFPDEDNREPGTYEDYNRRIRLHGVKAPAELMGEHYSIQFKAEHHGYLCSLPCPESGAGEDGPHNLHTTMPDGVKIARNGFAGATFLKQQRIHEGLLVPILECACGMAWRVVSLDECEPVFEALEYAHRRLCDSRHPSDGKGGWTEATQGYDVPTDYSVIAERIRQGFNPEYVAELFGRVFA